jgi:hypothetical protein
MTEVAMSLSLYALTCGHLEGEFGRLMEGGEGNITVPIPVFLIEHRRGERCSTPACILIARMTPPAAWRANDQFVQDQLSSRRGSQRAARSD